MTRDLDTLCQLHSMLLSQQGLGIGMSFMTWTRLTVVDRTKTHVRKFMTLLPKDY